jgi:F-type H+-transporting ATPase subunit delta
VTLGLSLNTAAQNLTELAAADPGAQAIGRVYAQSLLDAAGDNADSVLAEYQEFIEKVLAAYPDLARLVESPVISLEEKQGVLDRLTAGRSSEVFASYLRVLNRHRRLDLLAAAYGSAMKLREGQLGRQSLQVITAVPMSESLKSEVVDRLRQQLQTEPLVETIVDPSVIGGIVVRFGDTVYDGSVRTRVKQLRVRLRERCLNEIQRGRDRFSHPEGN